MKKQFSQYDTIVCPVYSEKSNRALESDQILFQVLKKASKGQVKSAIEKVFNVKVTAINTVSRKGKVRRFKGKKIRKKDRKFAYVTIEKGQTIDIAAGAA